MKKKPVMIKSQSFAEMLAEGVKTAEKAAEEFKKNGGICLHCGKNPGDLESTVQTMHCKDCNKETEDLLKQLRGPGFMELRVRVRKK